jgi:GT2 family glycosyltransferase
MTTESHAAPQRQDDQALESLLPPPAEEGRPGVAVIIPSWNTLEYLSSCIASVRDETDVEFELLVVDNGSVDGSVNFLQQMGIAHIGLSENLGFARAVNLAARRTHAPLLLVLNADVVLEPGCLRTLVAAIAKDSTLAGVQPKIIAHADLETSVKIYSAGQGLTIAASAYEIGKGEPDGPAYRHAREIFGVCGAVCLLRRELFTELGGYDERYFAFYEDVDLNARARLADWRFSYVPGAVALHVGHAAWRKQAAACAFNVRLTMQNRASTAIKVLPARCLPWVLLATARTLIASPFRRVGRAAIAGTLSILPWLPELLRERRRLRSTGGSGLDPWLTNRRVDRLGRRG